MFASVVIPTYNRLPILEKCLLALEDQRLTTDLEAYEVVVVDDGSSDGTPDWLRRDAGRFPHVRLVEQAHGGPAEGRNRGVDHARGDVIVFIDSDLVVTPTFLASHAAALKQSWSQRGDRLCFTYGAVINTANFESPTAERHRSWNGPDSSTPVSAFTAGRILNSVSDSARWVLFSSSALRRWGITGIRHSVLSRSPI